MVLLLLGILLVVAALPVSHKKGVEEYENSEKTELEEKLEHLLSNVEGVGETEVILMMEEERDSQGFGSSKVPKVTGVLISAQGGDDSVTVQKIQEAVKALFQIEPHKIKVMKRK